jgi:hypothetical protein
MCYYGIFGVSSARWEYDTRKGLNNYALCVQDVYTSFICCSLRSGLDDWKRLPLITSNPLEIKTYA